MSVTYKKDPFTMNPQECHKLQGLKAHSLSLARRQSLLRDVWLHDDSPAEFTNVSGSDHICMPSEATVCAKKNDALAVGFFATRTSGAETRGVVRINKHNLNADQRRFIGDEGP